MLALNARAEVIRTVGRVGLEELPQSEREQLPEKIDLGNKLYEKWLNMQLMVHMPFSEEMLWKVYQAQVARDETMAENLAQAWRQLQQPEEWIGVVICGGVHCAYGLGVPSRLQRRLPETSSRIIMMSESGDSEMTEAEKAMAREVTITHEDMRFMQQPLGDYLHVIEQNPETDN